LFQIAEPFLYFSVWSFVVALILVSAVSLLTRPMDAARVAGLMYERKPQS
jgi:hypothetical protein